MTAPIARPALSPKSQANRRRGARRANPLLSEEFPFPDQVAHARFEGGHFSFAKIGRNAHDNRNSGDDDGISPLLANVFLHFVFDLWVHRWRKQTYGCVSVVRYADDFVMAFESEADARKMA
jgi:hypothetical protein